MTDQWKHDDLMRDLEAHLRSSTDRMVWEDMQLGPSGSMRPDVYTMQKSFANPQPRVYECKVSVADFRSDVTKGKYLNYFSAASGVTFCVPEGLINRNEIPKGCGLMVRKESGWHTLKAPTLSRVNLNEDVLLKLLIDGVDRLDRKNRSVLQRSASWWMDSENLRKKFGQEVGRYVHDKHSAEERLERLKSENTQAYVELQKAINQKKELLKQYQDEAIAGLVKVEEFMQHPITQLKQALGLPTDCSEYTLRNAISDVSRFASEDKRLELARNMVESVKRSVDHATKMLTVPGEATP